MAPRKVVADVVRLPEHPSLVTSFRRQRIWIWLIAVALMVAPFHPCVAAQTTANDAVSPATNQIENSISLSPASNVSVTSEIPAPKRIIVDDPPPRAPGTKRRAQVLASFALTIISLLVLIVGIGVLRAFRQR